MSKNSVLDSAQLTDSMYYILLSLLEARHGYAIMKFIEDITHNQMRMGPGTLYTLLKKLHQANWIEQISNDSDRQKVYKISQEGVKMVIQEYQRRAQMVDDGKRMLKEAGYER